MLDDYVIAASAAVITASVVILVRLLLRYRELVRDASKSTRMAKDVWEAMNSRFSVMDSRIIDLMARTEVLSSRISTVGGRNQVADKPQSSEGESSALGVSQELVPVVRQSVPSVISPEGRETEWRVLQLLVGGPKSSAEIKEGVGRSREHTARLMKGLFDRGFVVRNDRHKPYVYEITEKGKSYVAS